MHNLDYVTVWIVLWWALLNAGERCFGNVSLCGQHYGFGMGRNGDTKSGLGPGAAGMFSLVGKIKLAFLDRRCQDANFCWLVLTIAGRTIFVF